MNMQVSRYLFWNTQAGTLRHAEHSPPKTDSEHQVCNCTKHVTERPAGVPGQIHPSIEWTAQMGKYRVRLEVGESQVHFTLHWTREVPRVSPWGTETEDHAYFWFYPENKLQVEVTGTGDNGDVDCTLGRVFFGNQIDISLLYNGHSPSEIVDLTRIAPDALWAHDCCWGHEAMDFLIDPAATQWRQQFERAKQIQDLVCQYDLRHMPLGDLRQSLLGEQTLTRVIDESFLWLVQMTAMFTKTEMCRAIREVKQRAREAERASRTE